MVGFFFVLISLFQKATIYAQTNPSTEANLEVSCLFSIWRIKLDVMVSVMLVGSSVTQKLSEEIFDFEKCIFSHLQVTRCWWAKVKVTQRSNIYRGQRSNWCHSSWLYVSNFWDLSIKCQGHWAHIDKSCYRTRLGLKVVVIQPKTGIFKWSLIFFL